MRTQHIYLHQGHAKEGLGPIKTSQGQTDFLYDWYHRFLLFLGAPGAGKTYALVLKLWFCHLWNAFDYLGEPTGIVSAIMAPTHKVLRDSTLKQLYNIGKMLNLTLIHNKQEQRVYIPELSTRKVPSYFLLVSANDPDTITGFSCGTYAVDEACRILHDYGDEEPLNSPLTQIVTRLRAARMPGQVHKSVMLRGLYASSSEGDHVPVYRWFTDPMHSKTHAIYHMPLTENLYDPEFCAMMMETMTDKMKRQYIGGEILQIAGQRAYADFDPEIHINDELAVYDPSYPLQLSFDFNARMHATLGQYHKEIDRFVCLQECAPGDRKRFELPQCLTEIYLSIFRDYKPSVIEVFGDASGKYGSGTGAKAAYTIIKEHLETWRKGHNFDYSLNLSRANPDHEERLNAMAGVLMGFDNKPHWYCRKKCSVLIRDLLQVRRDMYGKIDKKQERSGLVHMSDAESYKIFRLKPVYYRLNDYEQGRG